MNPIKWAARHVFRWRDGDLRSVKSRLRHFNARDMEVSAYVSLTDSPGAPNDYLLDLIPALARRAKAATLPLLREREAPAFVHAWPGEHYRLLAALVAETTPRHIVEIGTCQGFSALAMLSTLAPGATMTTFDLWPWDRFPGTALRSEDFKDGRLRQVIADLGEAAQAERHAQELRTADLIFVDASKDGFLEQRILDNFARVGLKPGALVVFDDVRLWKMLEIWRRIPFPKIDLTTIGHYTGTGVVVWQPSQRA